MDPNAPTLRAVTYSRCSTADQRLEPQTLELRAHATAHGLAIVGEFTDAGISGTKANRPGLAAAMEELRQGRADVLLCVRLDRLARSVRHLTELGEELEALGADLVCSSQAIDTTTPAGKLLFHVLGAVGAFERDIIVQRTKAGLSAAVARGSRLGRRPKLTDDDVEAARRALDLPNTTLGTVAEAFRVSRRTLERALARDLDGAEVREELNARDAASARAMLRAGVSVSNVATAFRCSRTAVQRLERERAA